MLRHHHVRSSRFHRARRSSMAESVYHSPRFRHAVRWENPWVAKDQIGESTDPDLMVVGLQAAGGAEVEIVGGEQRNLLDAPEQIRFWTSDGYLSEFMEPGTKVVLTQQAGTSGVVVMVSPGAGDGAPVVTIKETYTLGHGIAFRVTFTSDLAALEESYSCLRQSVKIDQHALGSALGGDVLSAIFS